MGIMDKFTNILGGNKSKATETVKGPSLILRENGIDPSNLTFSFQSNGTVAVSGTADSQSECDRICKVIEGIPTVKGVQNNIIIAAPGAEVVTEAKVTSIETEEAGRTYTVQSGDTLWAIAQKMYGSGGKYMKIFEANTSILDNPDKLRPGQKLVIPDIEN